MTLRGFYSDHSSLLSLLAVLFCIFIVGIWSADDYGITLDEITEVDMIKWNLDYMSNGTSISRNLKYYGTAFNGLAEGIYQILKHVGRTTPERIRKMGIANKNID